MKILLDSCVWGGVRQALADTGHDVVWCGDWARDPGDIVCLRVLTLYDATLQAGAIITAELERVRIRQPGGLQT